MGEYIALSYYRARASYVGDRGRRRLLVPGRRLVITLGIIKRADMQINYGSGRDVGDETIADAKRSLNIRWLSGSFIEIPVLNVE